MDNVFLVSVFVVFSCAGALRSVDNHIVNGGLAALGDHSFAGVLQQKSGSSWSLFCGAVYVGKSKVLTSAHCVNNRDKESFRVALGVHKLTDDSSGEPEYFAVETVTLHPQFGQDPNLGYHNDIAVLELDGEPSNSNSFIEQVALPETNGTHEGQNCRMIGWGRIYGGGPYPEVPYVAAVSAIANEQCSEYYGGVTQIEDGEICAYNGFNVACSGDTGGPYVCRSGGEEVLVGIMSFSMVGCVVADYPTVNTRVAYYNDFIENA